MENKIGEYILKYIQLNATNQSEICKIASIPPSQLNETIKGKRPLSPKIAFELGVRLKGFSAKKILDIQTEIQLEGLKKQHLKNKSCLQTIK